MRDSIGKVIQGIGFGFVLLVAVYVGGYFFTVRKYVSRTGAQEMPGGSRELYVVTANLGGNMTRDLFQPAFKIDRSYLRKRYWSGWYVVIDKNGTSILSAEQMAKRLRQ